MSMHTGTIPLALAKVYRLRIIEPSYFNDHNASHNIAYDDNNVNVNDALAQAFSPQQLKSNVTVEFPIRGGRIQKLQTTTTTIDNHNNNNNNNTNDNNDQEHRFVVLDQFGRVKRNLLLDPNGRVMEVLQNYSHPQYTPNTSTASNITTHRSSRFTNSSQRTLSTNTTAQRKQTKTQNNSISLGLGDFIFYSLLVSKAAMHSFTTFAACVLVILMGLAGTLMLLSLYQMALPALPISILLGVLFYLLTRIVIEPWIQDIFHFPLYV